MKTQADSRQPGHLFEHAFRNVLSKWWTIQYDAQQDHEEKIDFVLVRPIGSVNVSANIRVQVTNNLDEVDELKKLRTFLEVQRREPSTGLSIYCAAPSSVEPEAAALGFSDLVFQLAFEGLHRQHSQVVVRCAPDLSWSRLDPDQVMARLQEALVSSDPRTALPDSVKGERIQGQIILYAMEGNGRIETPSRRKLFYFLRRDCDARVDALLAQQARKNRPTHTEKKDLVPVSIPVVFTDGGYRFEGAPLPQATDIAFDMKALG